ncbi:hypothetical protein Pint_16453 [Pistacia integerrima]|uniref:Uncharacterized protein n=1 Tax=Pistacia integerrima TaxID=434235 RepID=A0ACC0ZFS8_9ROSI|nr:hypothetical protein Pint_16453 [Pistacia integerrima]
MSSPRTEVYESYSQTGDCFKIWPELEPTKTLNQELPNGSAIFSILIKHSYLYPPELYLSPYDDLNDLDDLIFSQMDKTFEVECDLLINNDASTSRSILEDKLIDVSIRTWPSMIDNILKCAHDMPRNKEFASHKVLHMHGRVDVIVEEADEFFSEDDEDEIEEFPDDMEVEPMIVPASKSAIGKLEMIKIEDESRLCVVCLEQILLGSQATRMPCGHLFHGDCILSWLSKSKRCPLCRFELD